MKTICRGFVVALAVSLVPIPAAAQEPPKAVHPDAVTLIEAWLEASQAYLQMPSLAVSLVQGDKVVFAKGYGHADTRRRVPTTPETLYSICSISKTFTAIAVMQLYERGKLRLDDEITAHIPEFKLKPVDDIGSPVTIRSLLSHSAGLPREAVGGAYWMGPEYTFPARDAMLAGLATQDMFERPAERYQYSNLGVALLGEIVQRASGQSYDDYIRENVLGPLKLANTSTRIPDERRGDTLAVGYGARKRDGTRDVIGPFDTRGVTPAAGFSSSVADLSSYMLWQFRLLRTNKAEVLKPSSLREMQRIQWTDPDGKTTWGLGFGVSRTGNDVFVSHAGWCPGYRSAITMIPAKEIGVAVAMGSQEPPARFTRPILALAQKTPPKAPDASAGKPAALADYAGRYSGQPWSDETIIRPWGSDLVGLTMPSDNPAEDMTTWRHVEGDRFRRVRDDKTLGESLTFTRDASGKVTGYRIWAGGARRVE